jgi:hypothetical protein
MKLVEKYHIPAILKEVVRVWEGKESNATVI